MNALDTNVLVYSVDADGKEKRVKALDLLARLAPNETVILWQVACELSAVLTRLAATGRADADPLAVVNAVTTRFPLVLPPESLVSEGLRLRAAHQMSYWDALLLAGCVSAGVNQLYTEDIQGRPEIEGVRIVNPFL